MTGCCSFPNLGCLQIPTNTTTITGPPGATGAAGAAGAAGATGAAGDNGTTNIISDSTTDSTPTLTSTVIKTGAITSNTLATNGDALNIRVSFNHTATSSLLFDDSFKIAFGGQSFFVGISSAIAIPSANSAFVDIRFVKTGTTTATALFSYYGGASGVFNGYTEVTALTALDFTISNNITISSVQAVASRVECTGLYVDLITA
jgi:hypothetical protein